MKPAEFRIFLSSTFTDLQPEREHLVKKTFPRIRAKCRERGVEFTEIDLRWGITSEESRSGKVVRICLEEIDRCRPYFIGILGSRYGWVPRLAEYEKDPETLKKYPWLTGYAERKKSIVEIEIAHAALFSDPKNSTFIYEQTSAIDHIPKHDRKPFDELKQTLRLSLPYKQFATEAELGEQVYTDLLALLDRDWPEKKEPTPLETERLAHEAFALNRTQSYIADPQYIERFEAFAASDDAPLILWGKSGLGKSALVAYLTDEYSDRHPEQFIVRHFVGAAAGASSAVDLIRHVMLEIKARYDLPDELPTDDGSFTQEFPAWLAKVRSDEKLILAIDAVNQLSGIGPEMHWLPEFIPTNVRLIISTTPEVPLEQLRKRNWQELEIGPLGYGRRLRISDQFLARYHKHLDPELLEIIADSEKLQSPLFLRTLLEELRVFGVHEAIDSYLANYLAAKDEDELFQKVLERMERDHGAFTVGEVMSAIWASRYGLTETELLEITGLTRLALSEFLIALEFHLMQRSGLYTFFHNYLREAVEFRYLATDDDKKAAHSKLGEYFSKREYSDRRSDEEPWQWQQAENWQRYKSCLTDLELLDTLLDESKRHELIRFWTVLKEHYDLGEIYHEAFTSFERTVNDPPRTADIASRLGDALVAASIYPEAEYLLRYGLDKRRELFGGEDLESAQSMNDLATLFYHTGNFKEAEPLFRKAVEIRENILGKNDPKAAKSLNDLGAILFLQGKFDEAEVCFRTALEMFQGYYKTDHAETADTLSNLGSVLYSRKHYLESVTFFNLATSMFERLYGENYIALVTVLSNLGLCYSESGEYGK
ncbi:MAG TPA: tetratricopeptide repeat protein, partial [Candidatus Kapabacteria bacterium]|nr:tetratricopeptide repeat protein [Candidatus Kapabacteria bacterium]